MCIVLKIITRYTYLFLVVIFKYIIQILENIYITKTKTNIVMYTILKLHII